MAAMIAHVTLPMPIEMYLNANNGAKFLGKSCS